MPSGLQTLATLGKLYESEGAFSKIVKCQEYKEKKEDKEKNERVIEKANKSLNNMHKDMTHNLET